jgi:hypothetical protein
VTAARFSNNIGTKSKIVGTSLAAETEATHATVQIPQSPDWLVQAKDAAAATQGFVTSVALLSAGVWFIRRRLRLPRLKITHDVTVVPFDGDHVLLRVSAKTENIGDVIAYLEGAVLDIHQIHPLLPEVATAIAIAHRTVPWRPGRMRWPLLFHRRFDWRAYNFEVEPGEAEVFPFDVILPKTVEVVQVYSHISNKSKWRKRVGWNLVSIVELSDHLLSPLRGAENTDP